MGSHILYLDAPATSWDNGTPVGCGSLGAVTFGRVEHDILQLNEEFIWASRKSGTPDPDFYEKLQHMRQMLLRGESCDEYANEALKDSFCRLGSYETAGELHLHFDHSDYCDYARKIYMDKGVAEITYRCGDTRYTRTVFASHPQNTVVMHISADRPESVSFTAEYARDRILEMISRDDLLTINACTACMKHHFTVKIRTVCDGGSFRIMDHTIYVTNANAVTLLITIGTVFPPKDPEYPGYEALLYEHERDFSSLFCRSDIAIPEDEKADLPIPKRLARVKNGEKDPGLIPLYFAFGKYLMIGSSREDTLPANLQGVWCKDTEAPWNSDYHTNINLQMNYWPVYVANIGECGKALEVFLKEIVLPGAQKAASLLYDCNGAVLHHVTDVYGFAYPADGVWGLWPHGGGWLCRNLWEAYLFRRDKEELSYIYVFLKQCALFYMDYLFEQDGKLYSGPSTSPENRYKKDGKAQFLCVSPTMDMEIIADCLGIFIRAAEILGTDREETARAKDILARLPGLKIGSRGQLLEWAEEYEEMEPGHRHISHAYALYPGNQINHDTPELMDAITKTIRLRLENGGGHTGWSAAWLICLFARLGDGSGVEKMLHQLFTRSTLDNFFDNHPPFQIDGNFGASAGIAEALLQSHEGFISLLPALPESMKNGSFTRLMARGGTEVSAEWTEGRVTSFSLLSPEDTSVSVLVNGCHFTIPLTAGVCRKTELG